MKSKKSLRLGDWVVYFNGEPHGNKTNKIELIEDGCAYFDEYRRRSMLLDSLRHATPEEIAEEKERRWWAKHGREVRELRKGDLLREKSVRKIYNVRDVTDESICFSGDVVPIDKKELTNKFVVVCFAEDRLDLNE